MTTFLLGVAAGVGLAFIGMTAALIYAEARYTVRRERLLADRARHRDQAERWAPTRR